MSLLGLAVNGPSVFRRNCMRVIIFVIMVLLIQAYQGPMESELSLDNGPIEDVF